MLPGYARKPTPPSKAANTAEIQLLNTPVTVKIDHGTGLLCCITNVHSSPPTFSKILVAPQLDRGSPGCVDCLQPGVLCVFLQYQCGRLPQAFISIQYRQPEDRIKARHRSSCLIAMAGPASKRNYARPGTPKMPQTFTFKLSAHKYMQLSLATQPSVTSTNDRTLVSHSNAAPANGPPSLI